MVVTGVAMTTRCDAAAFLRASQAAGIGDSKGLCAHGAMGEVEGFVLAVLEVHLGLRVETFSGLVAALCLDDDAALRVRCPEGAAPSACFDEAIALPAFGAGVTPALRARATALAAAGVAVSGARFALACARRLRDARDLGQSRFDVDLGDMLRLVARLGAGAASHEVACGKVGGRNKYAAALEALSPLVSIEVESSALSRYQVPGLGRIAFVRDGDATEPAVAMASLLGKYVRELAMLRHNRFYQARVEGLVAASGYHDPVTARFVDATALVRARLGIDDRCFER